jgi:lipid-A-disaccharide synthase
LPNIILGRESVKELIQNDMKLNKVKSELDKLLNDEAHRKSLLKDYEELQNQMGEPGCSKRCAEKMVEFLRKD